MWMNCFKACFHCVFWRGFFGCKQKRNVICRLLPIFARPIMLSWQVWKCDPVTNIPTWNQAKWWLNFLGIKSFSASWQKCLAWAKSEGCSLTVKVMASLVVNGFLKLIPVFTGHYRRCQVILANDPLCIAATSPLYSRLRVHMLYTEYFMACIVITRFTRVV